MVTALPVPTAVYTSTDTRIMQMRTLLRAELQTLMTRHSWSALRTTSSPTLTAASSLASLTLPADFARFVRDGKIWSTTYRRPLVGPLSQNEWQAISISGIPTSILYWRMTSATTIQIAGATTGDVITYDYQSKYPVIAVDGVTTKAAFSADTDSPRMPETLVEMGLHWRFLKANNLDYAEEMSTYERELERACNEDKGEIRSIMTSDEVIQPNLFPLPKLG